jgi:ssDNA-binding Zn-finger/Zn-ribbon topoisomerase 1
MATEEKPSRNEDEYFVRLDAELLKAQRVQLDEQRAAQERKQHYMKCPKCGHDLAEREFQHVKVDVCPNCHGMWLDKGELDMIEHVEQRHRGGFLGSLFGLRR